MSKLRILAGLFIVLTGCSTTTRRVDKAHNAEEPFNEVKKPAMETEHITEAPSLAPPPVAAPGSASASVAANHFTGSWIPLKRWSADNDVGPVQRISAGLTPTFALKATGGLFIFSANNQVAYWNSLEIHLGFAPTLIDDHLYIHSLDIAKNIKPLLQPLVLPVKTNRIIVIDPGHGGSNLGTTSVFDGAHEKQFTLDWARRLAAILATNGWQVFLTRTSDTDVSLDDRAAFAEAHNADLFISLHFNAGPTPADAGIETYCLTPAGMNSTLTRDYEDDPALVFPNNRFDTENLQYALKVQRSLLKTSGAHDHGIRRARFMRVLRLQNRPAILVEAGYLSNAREARRIAEPEYRQKLAEGVALALIESNNTRPVPATHSSTNPPIQSVEVPGVHAAGTNNPHQP